eukprot:COSAG05_NODE_320_length_11481_cov_32.028730_5_plen_280_part_00
MVDPTKLKVVELRQELASRGLTTVGRKAELCERLTDALESEADETEKKTPAEPPSSEAGSGAAASQQVSDAGATMGSDFDLDGLVASALSVFESSLGGAGGPSTGSITLGGDSQPRPKEVAERAAELEAAAVDDVLRKTIMDGIEAPKDAVEKYKKPPREKKYFDFESTEMTDAVRRDLEVLRMRTFINPKKHYKGSDHQWKPKKFQIGTVVLPPQEYYSQAGSKRELKRGALDALKGDKTMMAYTKRKFMEAQAATQAGGKKSYKRKMKKRRPKWAGS